MTYLQRFATIDVRTAEMNTVFESRMLDENFDGEIDEIAVELPTHATRPIKDLINED